MIGCGIKLGVGYYHSAGTGTATKVRLEMTDTREIGRYAVGAVHVFSETIA
jgi:hypothetical protein